MVSGGRVLRCRGCGKVVEDAVFDRRMTPWCWRCVRREAVIQALYAEGMRGQDVAGVVGVVEEIR